MLPDCVVHSQSRSPTIPVLLIGRLRVHDQNLFGVSIPVGSRFSIGPDKFGKRGAFSRFMNAGVQFVAQSVIDGKPGRSFPRVLKIKVVGLPPNSSFIELVAGGSEACNRRDAVGIGRRGQQARKRIGQRITSLDVVPAAGGGNRYRGVRRTPTERVGPVGIGAEDRGVAVKAYFHSPLERV